MFYKKCRNQLEENSDVSKKIPKSQKSSDTDSIFMRIVSVLVVISIVVVINTVDFDAVFIHNSEQSRTNLLNTINSLIENKSEYKESQTKKESLPTSKTEEENFYISNSTELLNTINSLIENESEYKEPQTEKESLPASETEEKNSHISDSEEIQNHYPVEFIGKTVEETIDVLGTPQEIKNGFLGGGGTDTAYLYDDGNIIFIALFDFSDNFYFDDRDARINYICIWDGSLNEYVEMGMSYNEINQFYSLSDYSYDAHDNGYIASADFMYNNRNCTLIITSSDGNKTTPINRILLTCSDVRN